MEYTATWRKYKKGIGISTLIIAMFGLGGGIIAALCFAFFGFCFSYIFSLLLFLVKLSPEEREAYARKREAIKQELRQNKSQESASTTSTKNEENIRKTKELEKAKRKEEKRRRKAEKKQQREKQRQLKQQAIEEAKQHEEERKKMLEEQRLKQIKWWETEDLSVHANKIDGLKLSKTEYCYYRSSEPVNWKEDRVTTRRVNYGGLTTTIHIAKGINYRLGSINTGIHRNTRLTTIITGTLFLTNKRLIVANDNQLKTYTFRRLLKMEPYSDGTILYSSAGKRVVLDGFNDATKFNIYLDRLTSE